MSNTINKFDWQRQALAQPFNGSALRVLLCYAAHADTKTLITFPTIRDVSDQTNISVERVGRYRKALLEAGWLEESEEKTRRGNPKLRLAIGSGINHGYLGEKKRVHPRSAKNLVPAAKQKLKESLENPDESNEEAGLDNRGGSGLGNREMGGLDFPDVIISELNNQSRIITYNKWPVSADASPGLYNLITTLGGVVSNPPKSYRLFSLRDLPIYSFLKDEGITSKFEDIETSGPGTGQDQGDLEITDTHDSLNGTGGAVPAPIGSNDYLELLLEKELRHTKDSKDEARRLFFDETWREDDSETKRAAAAVCVTIPKAGAWVGGAE